jgi:hypothetical protein
MRALILLLCLLLNLAGCAAPSQTTRETPLPSPAHSTTASLAEQPRATLAIVQPSTTPSSQRQDSETITSACPLATPIWAKPPTDSAVQGLAEFGYYFVNEDRSIWASAWWTGQDDYHLRVSEDGVKVGWFRPAGATLAITGQRIDAPAPALEAHVPCCYPTRFQATGLIFPTEGCWEVRAKAAASELSFVVWVEP